MYNDLIDTNLHKIPTKIRNRVEPKYFLDKIFHDVLLN